MHAKVPEFYDAPSNFRDGKRVFERGRIVELLREKVVEDLAARMRADIDPAFAAANTPFRSRLVRFGLTLEKWLRAYVSFLLPDDSAEAGK
jgi:hypothetical protein